MTLSSISPELSIQTYRNGIKLISPKENKRIPTKIAHFSNLPFNVYLIDSNYFCRYANIEQGASCGFMPQDILDKPIKRFMDKSIERVVTKNNTEVMESHSFKILEEEGFLTNGLHVQSLSIKLPWYNMDNKICGIFGFAIILNKHSIASALTTIGEFGFLKREQFQLHSSKIHDVYLTKRENEILKFILKGYTQKQIAKIFALSSRTIEFHLINIKNKFKVNSRSDLVDLLM